MQHPALFLSADSSIGRVDIGSLTDQTLMELLVDGLTDASKEYFEKNGFYENVCMFRGITCDEDQRVIKYVFQKYYCEGTVSLDFIPPLVVSFYVFSSNIQNIQFCGTLSTETLPKYLEVFDISQNAFSGAVDMTKFPPQLIKVNISKNVFCGTCDFTSLPRGLRELSLRKNKFCGNLVLNSLPLALERLSLSENHFSGTLKLENLPARMRTINVSLNELCGEFRLVNVPESLQSVFALQNAFCGTAVITSTRPVDVFLGGDNCAISAVVDENGETHKLSKRIVRKV